MARSFVGGQSFATTEDTAFRLSSALSLSAIVKPTFVSGSYAIMGKVSSAFTNGYWIQQENADLVFYAHISGSNRSTTATVFSADTWCHVGATFDGTVGQLYFNGAAVGTPFSQAGTITTSTQVFNLGVVADTTNRYSGTLAELAVWNTPLSAGEMASLGKCFSPQMIRPASQVAYWPFAGRANPEPDIVGGYNATIAEGSPAYADHPRVIYPKRSA